MDYFPFLQAATNNFSLDSSGLNLLTKEKDKVLAYNESECKRWNKMKAEYETLDSQLGKIADKITYDVMVPFSKKAFIPGKLAHTNEVTVLLGENWFLKCSAKHAKEICQRRIERCIMYLERFKKEHRFHSSWREQAKMLDEGNDVKEINEEYDEEKEKLWRIKHKESMRAHKRREAEIRKQMDNTDREYWDKLEFEELELEMASNTQDPSALKPAVKTKPVKQSRRVSFANVLDDSDEDETLVIHFTHSESSSPVPNDSNNLESPGDILRLFTPTAEPIVFVKSILKASKNKILKYNTSISEEDITIKKEDVPNITAVEDEVIEHSAVKTEVIEHSSVQFEVKQCAVKTEVVEHSSVKTDTYLGTIISPNEETVSYQPINEINELPTVPEIRKVSQFRVARTRTKK